MKSNERLEKLFVERFDRLEGKVDELRVNTIPDIYNKITEAKTESTTAARIHGRIWGAIAIGISAVSVAVAYFK